MKFQYNVHLFFNLTYFDKVASNKEEKNIPLTIKNQIGQMLVSFQKRFYNYTSLLDPTSSLQQQSQKFYYSVVSTGDNKFIFYKVYNKEFLKEDKYTHLIQVIYDKLCSQVKNLGNFIKIDIIGLTKTKVNIQGIDKQSCRMLAVAFKLQLHLKNDNEESLIDNYVVYPLAIDNFHFKQHYNR